MNDPTVIDLVAELEKATVEAHMLHQGKRGQVEFGLAGGNRLPRQPLSWQSAHPRTELAKKAGRHCIA